MVLEQIITARRLERNPSLILAISFIFVSFAIILTNYFYPNDRGMVVLLLQFELLSLCEPAWKVHSVDLGFASR